MNRQVQQLRNKVRQNEKTYSDLKAENDSLRAQLKLTLNSYAPDDLNAQIINTNEILSETREQLKKLEGHNLLLQNKMKQKVPPRAKLRGELIRLKGIIQNKNKILEETNNKTSKVFVNIDGVTKGELKNVNLRKRVAQLLNSVNNKPQVNESNMIQVHINDDNIVDISDQNLKKKLEFLINQTNNNLKKSSILKNMIHVHINDDTLVDISDKNIKNQLKSLIQESKYSRGHKSTLDEIKLLIEKMKTNNKGVHVHLDDQTTVEFLNDEIKTKVLDLITNVETIMENPNLPYITDSNNVELLNMTNNTAEEDVEEEEDEEEDDEEDEEDDDDDEEGDNDDEDDDDEDEDDDDEDEDDDDEEN